MIVASLLAAGALSLRAAAFLVVPEVDSVSTPFPKTVQPHAVSQVSLKCTECPFPDRNADGEVTWTDGFDTALDLNVSVENENALVINGNQVFPPPPPPLSINAVQRRIADGRESTPIPLGFALEVEPLVAPMDEPGPELLSLRFTVLDLAGHPVPLSTVVIALIKDESGSLFLVKTDVEEPKTDIVSWRQCRGKPKCLQTLLFSRVRSLVESAKARMMKAKARLMGSKGCHGGSRFPMDAARPPRPMFEEFGRPHRRPHPGGRHHFHHMHRSGWERTFSRVFRFILVPAVLGVLAGLVASALGMLVGQVVVFLWLRYRRSTTDRSVSAVEEGDDMEKEALIAEPTDDLPPEYDDEEHGAIVLPAEKH
ncbi:hypothetical protein Plec18167_007052 [Paecilomyces lecythidis]|uniref:DUF7728 domain-containing protein n=1 Tax=Paecilomyces lecythidis TaxID=3004212 RepID=A0ABR3X738_9EURO